MTLGFALYWSFRSPYSYLVTDRIIDLVATHDVECRLCVVYPIAVRQPDFFAHADPLWFSYFARDIHRSAEFAGIPFAWASPDPVIMDPATRSYPRDQPHIHRLTRLGMAATERGKGLAFIAEVGRLIWSGTVRGWNAGLHLAEATARAGLDLAELDAAIAVPGEAERLDAIIAGHQAQQRDGGHYGVPLMVFEGEPFFGQDRFDQLVWRMRQQGLTARSS